MKNLLKVSILAALIAQSAHAADIRVLAYGEHVGTEIVYRYTLINNGPGHMEDISIGTVDAGDSYKTVDLNPAPGVYINPGQANTFSQLSRAPTGTTFVVDPDWTPRNMAVHNQASVTMPALPAGWTAKMHGRNDTKLYSVEWTAPGPRIQKGADGSNNVSVSGADAGQTLSGFSVRA